jgi:predicted MPP superfamily phosphohydrolase
MSRTAQFAAFFAVAVAVLIAVHGYLWFRLVRDTALVPPWRQVATVALIALALSMPLVMGLDRVLPPALGRGLSVVPFVWMGAMVLFVFWFAATDLVRLAGFAAAKATGSTWLAAQRLPVARAIAVGGVLVVAVLTGISVVVAARAPTVTRLELRIPALPKALDGFRIAQISDVHLGESRGGAWLADVAAQVNALAPDLVAITGDLVDASPEVLRDEVAAVRELRAPHGVFFVIGNHEHYAGLAAWMPVLRGLGLRVLRNERVVIGAGDASFDLVGVDDDSAHGGGGTVRPDLPKATAGRDPARAAVLLVHQPKVAIEAAAHGIDLVLAGHTHGGQIWPFSALVRLQQPFLRGLYQVSERTRLYVTDGTGLWGPPMRLGTRNEIVLVTLRAGG